MNKDKLPDYKSIGLRGGFHLRNAFSNKMFEVVQTAYNNATLERLKNEENSMLKLLSLLAAGQQQDKIDDVSKGLLWFREAYQYLPYKYPSDIIYIELLSSCIAKGNSFDDAKAECHAVIEREIKLLAVHHAVGLPYTERFIAY